MFDKVKNRTGILALVSFVVGVLLTGFAFYMLPILPSLATTQPSNQAAGNVSNISGSDLIADIVDKTSPAVVMIQTRIESSGRNYDPLFNDPFFREFFGRIPMDTGPRISEGMGSGFIISNDGYILTNEHVVRGAQKIEVIVSGKEKPIPAKLVGSDFELDLAVLKINGENDFPVLEIGDSEIVRVGEWVIAIGNPQGLDHTVTVGVISAKGRPVAVQDRQYKNLLQTDASINPGNSGGPLLNTKGQVIGINTAVNASAQGIGFAIPSSTVRPVLDTLINQGKITRPWLGVYVQTINKDMAAYWKLNKSEGVLVTSVVEGSPAYTSGINQGDIIEELENQKIGNAEDLTALVEKTKLGQQVEMVLHRNGKKMKINITIGEKSSVN